MNVAQRTWMIRSLCYAVIGIAGWGMNVSPVRANDDPADKAKLVRDLEGAYRAGNYQKALELAEKLNKLEPEDPTHMYNLACLNCLMGKKDKAYDWLEKSVDAGYKDADQMADDGDFKTIRGEDRFRALVKRVRDGAERGEAKRDVKKKQPKKDDDDGDDDDDDDDAPPAKKSKVEKKESKAKADAKEDKDDDKEDAEDVDERVQELTRDLIEAAEAKEYDRALKLALKAQKLADVGLTNYNVACMYSLLDKKDDAFKYLERAIKKGNFPTDLVQQMEGDSDLEGLRGDPRYKKMLAMAKGDKDEKPARKHPGGEGEKVKFEWKVTLPKGRDDVAGAPLVVVLHGFGGNMNEATKTWKKAAEKTGAVLLAPQGSFKLEDGKYQWGHDMDAVEESVMEAIDKVASEHKIDRHKIVLAGFSQGGAATWALALRNPDTIHAIIPVCGRCDAKSESAFGDADLENMRACILLGADDDKAMLKSNKDAAKKLEKKGAKVKISEFEGVGHAYPENADEELAKALKYVLAE